MSDRGDELLRRDSLRLAFLRRLYDVSDGNPDAIIPLDQIAAYLGIARQEAWSICDYLSGEYLVELVASGRIAITHDGRIEVETTIRDPDRGSNHFTPPVIRQTVIIANEIKNSAIAIESPGAHQTAGVSDYSALPGLVIELRELVASLGLDADDRAVIDADLQTVDIQLASPKPNLRAVRVVLASTQRILEGAVGGAAAPEVLDLFHRLAQPDRTLPH
jgi:hypothetical protein